MPKQRTIGVYKILNKTTGKFYIGSSIDIEGRWRKHRSFLKRCCHPNPYLQAVWNKYGEDAFEFLILEVCSEDVVLMREQQWLNQTRSYDKEVGYNLSSIAESGRGPKRVYIVTHPNGHEDTVTNLNEFCRKHDLNTGNMCQCARGKVRSCKGFRCRYFGVSNEEWETTQTKGHKSGRNPFVQWRINCPDGTVVETNNLRYYCQEKGLIDSLMVRVANGKSSHHKGYTCERIMRRAEST